MAVEYSGYFLSMADRNRQSSSSRSSRASGERIVRDELRDITRGRQTRQTRDTQKRSSRWSFLSGDSKRRNQQKSNRTSSSRDREREHDTECLQHNERSQHNERTSSYTSQRTRDGRGSTQSRFRSAVNNQRGGLLFFLGVIIVLIALLNIAMVFRSYAQNLGQLNALKSQEAELVQQKADLENDIQRWSDDAYVTAQARKRLGFVYPGERSVRVENAPADTQSDATSKTDTSQSRLPWFNELLYAIHNTDQAENSSGAASSTQ